MRKIALLIVFAAIAVLAQAQEDMPFSAKKPGEYSAPKFKWENLEHDFGQIDRNKPVSHEFKFENTGSAPIIISKVKGSCGCTVTEYTRTPVKPGESGVIKATFNAAAVGRFAKTVTVTANTEGGPVVLRIKGEVVTGT